MVGLIGRPCVVTPTAIVSGMLIDLFPSGTCCVWRRPSRGGQSVLRMRSNARDSPAAGVPSLRVHVWGSSVRALDRVSPGLAHAYKFQLRADLMPLRGRARSLRLSHRTAFAAAAVDAQGSVVESRAHSCAMAWPVSRWPE